MEESKSIGLPVRSSTVAENVCLPLYGDAAVSASAVGTCAAPESEVDLVDREASVRPAGVSMKLATPCTAATEPLAVESVFPLR